MARAKVILRRVKKKGAPAYMVSFGDMMTLILCFFILLVALAKERNFGLMAKGLGSFVIAVESFGLNGILSAEEKAEILEQVRRRFNLPPEEDPERRAEHRFTSASELLRAKALDALKPHRELHQPRLAAFAAGETALDADDRRHVDAQADSLRPGPGQTLQLEGHAHPEHSGPDPARIAFLRAHAVREYLIDRHGFHAERVTARAWLVEIDDDPRETDVVHARLVLPDGR